MLLGTYKHSLDTKNRLTLPSKLKSHFLENVMLSFGVDGCIELRTPESFTEYINLITSFGHTNLKSRNIQRFLLANSFEVQIDSASRILVPNILLELSKINKEVVIIGINDRLEIWDPKIYEAKFNEIVPSLSELMEDLEKK